jgi:hypothetical protein
MKSLKELSSDSFYNMHRYHQITIDFIQETENLIEDGVIEPIQALAYQLSVATEICNPQYAFDIEALLSLEYIIMKAIEKLEQVCYKTNKPRK